MSSSNQDKRLSVLYEISQIVARATKAERASMEVFNVLGDRLPVSYGALALRDTESGNVEIITSCSQDRAFSEQDFHLQWVMERLRVAIRTGYPQLISSLSSEIIQLTIIKSAWAVCVPIRVRGRTTGAILIEMQEKNPLISIENELDFFRIVCALLGQCVELQERLAHPGRVDEEARAIRPYARDLIGTSLAFRDVIQSIDRVGPGQATVLVRGESGTGKELVARALHEASARKEAPFVKVVCAALPETLLETALFGHEKGAFTGALEKKIGFLEEAQGGSVFLDEIGDIPHNTQVRLLRFLQEKTFERVGGTRPIAVDVRVITATNRDLELAVRQGKFRDDLYYRLNVVPITLPPLRDRAEDVPLLVDYFVKKFSRTYGREIVFSGDAIRKLQDYEWPGNIRELENFIERLMVLSPDGLITATDMTLPRQVPKIRQHEGSRADHLINAAGSASDRMTLREMEREEVIHALEEAGGVQTIAARRLGITPRQLSYRIRKYQISRASIQYG
jgi:Nif-specific regulatory protein